MVNKKTGPLPEPVNQELLTINNLHSEGSPCPCWT